MVDDLSQQIGDRKQQLETLEALLANRKLQNDVFLAGRPIKKGWMSSRYGRRTDPFTGGADWHSGVDFAAKENSDVIAVAAGVVTWADDRYQYGMMVEINHGNGFTTRYGHCKALSVKPGDIIKKGQVIGTVGSTGRSTGPHVHFEVHKNGRVVDPAAYIHRASR
jgi:murein DD-endopeptidase MepM/ murein hydrolase activator NlpD